MAQVCLFITFFFFFFFNHPNICCITLKLNFYIYKKQSYGKCFSIITNNNIDFNTNSLGFRYDNIVIEFEQYGLSSLLRNIVGASKISLATILVMGIWHNEYLFAASTIMAFLMLCAQFFHFRAKNNWISFTLTISFNFIITHCLFVL